MRRQLVAGLVAIGLLAAVALGGVYLATQDPPATPRSPADRRPEAAPPAGATAAVATPPAPHHGPPTPERPAASPRAIRTAAPETPWEAVPAAARPGALGPAGVQVDRALQRLQRQLASCFDPGVAARHGGQRITETREAEREDLGYTVLVLQIETLDGRARVVDAPVSTPGGADEATLACAQHHLRGLEVEAPGARPGTRLRLRHLLHP